LKRSIFHLFRPSNEPVVVGEVVSLGEGELQVNSPTWAFINQHCRQQIADLQTANNSIAKDPIETAALRGQIRGLQKILSLPETTARDISRKTHMSRPSDNIFAE
jgi:hypothetical protein